MSRRLPIFVCFAVMFGIPAAAAQVGTMAPPPPLSEARIAALPAAEQSVWRDYLKRSLAQAAADNAVLAVERAKLKGPVPAPVYEHMHDASMPLNRPSAWYATAEARHIADNIVSFQTPAGGWGKNQDRTAAARLPGQDFVVVSESQKTNPEDYGDTPEAKAAKLHFVGTLDNDATSTEMRFLIRVSTVLPGREGDGYRASFIKGVHYLLNSQYPNGGWPQVWPLEGGYHDAITYNDDAVSKAAQMLTEAAENKGGAYGFVPAALRDQARAASQKALDVILKTQIVENGKPAVWAQQHDMLTLEPVGARNFEPAFASTGESSDLLIYLMSLPDPSPRLQASIHAAALWLQAAAITGYEFTGADTPQGRLLKPKAGAGPLWARFYAADMKPRFADRDRSIHDDVADICLERRNGYSWYNTVPAKALKVYAKWAKAHPAP